MDAMQVSDVLVLFDQLDPLVLPPHPGLCNLLLHNSGWTMIWPQSNYMLHIISFVWTRFVTLCSVFVQTNYAKTELFQP